MRYLVECLGYSAFILEFYIAFDIILICLTGDCFINKLKLRDPIKSYDSIGFLPIHQCNVDNFLSCFRRQMGIGLQKKIGLECELV